MTETVSAVHHDRNPKRAFTGKSFEKFTDGKWQAPTSLLGLCPFFSKVGNVPFLCVIGSPHRGRQ